MAKPLSRPKTPLSQLRGYWINFQYAISAMPDALKEGDRTIRGPLYRDLMQLLGRYHMNLGLKSVVPEMVEACRLLSKKLIDARRSHDRTEDELLELVKDVLEEAVALGMLLRN